MEKILEELRKLEELHKNLPRQGTPEWLKLREKTIGGSEIAAIMGLSPYSTAKRMLASKLGIAKGFQGNTATRWGKLFEQITSMSITDIMQIPHKIFEFSSIPNLAIEHQAYSPDGLCVMHLLGKKGKRRYFAILLEFKAPFKSIPDGEVPEHYMPQVQSGLLTFPMCQAAVFVNAVYRKCPIQNLKFDDVYDTDFHVYNPTLKVSSIGFIGLYGLGKTANDDSLLALSTSKMIDKSDDSSSDESDSSSSDSSSSDSSSSDSSSSSESPYSIPMDFGQADSDEMDALLTDVELGNVFASYHPMSHRFADYDETPFVGLQKYLRAPFSASFEEKKQLEEINEFKTWASQEGRFYVGILPFKVMRMDIIQVKRDKDFAEKARKELAVFMKNLNELRRLPYREKIRRIDELYNRRASSRRTATSSHATHTTQPPSATPQDELESLFDFGA